MTRIASPYFHRGSSGRDLVGFFDAIIDCRERGAVRATATPRAATACLGLASARYRYYLISHGRNRRHSRRSQRGVPRALAQAGAAIPKADKGASVLAGRRFERAPGHRPAAR